MTFKIHKGGKPPDPLKTSHSPYKELIEVCRALEEGGWIELAYSGEALLKSKKRALRRMLREHVNPFRKSSNLVVRQTDNGLIIREA